MLYHLKWQEHIREFVTQNKDISSYMKLHLNNIMVLVFSPQTVTFFYPDPKTNYPVSLYNTMITYLYNSTSPENYRSIINDDSKIFLRWYMFRI